FKGYTRDSLYFRCGVRESVQTAILFETARFTKIKPTRELTHYQQIGPANDLGLNRRGVDKRVMQKRRTQIRIDAQSFAQRHQAGFRLQRRRICVVLRPADRAEQDCVTCEASAQSLLGKRHAARVERRPSDQCGLVLTPVTELFRDSFETC